MSRRRLAGPFSAIACGLLVAIGLSGCLGGDPIVTSSAPPTTTSTTTTVPASTIPTVSPSSTVPASTLPTSTLPAISTKLTPTTSAPTASTTVPPGGIEFHSPTGNIHCEINYGPPFPTDLIHCFTDEPPQSVTLSGNGTYSTCSGTTCLANPGEGEVDLPYGQNASKGPFVCASAVTGMTCTVNGKGFQISRSGIVPAG